MQLENLKKGMFGYTKESVLRYISTMEEDFSAKLVERDVQSKKAAETYTRRIQELEAALDGLKKEYEAQQGRQLMIADTLLEAQRYAAQMKAETEQRELELRQQLEKEAARYHAELDRYGAQVRELRERFHTLLRVMDQKAETMKDEIVKAAEGAPERHGMLFQRKTQPVQE